MDSRIKALEEKIRYYSEKYYGGQAEIPDAVFDKLIDELKRIDPDNPILSATGWGFKIDGNKKKFKHPYGRMGSISRKPRSIDGIPDTFTGELRITPKYDGLSGVAYYKNGELVRALTRGDGEYGVDVTDKMRVILGGSTKFYGTLSDWTGAFRGEFVISNNKWSEYKESHPDADHPRNVASGIINRDGVTDVEFLDFVVYKIIASDRKSDSFNSGLMSILHSEGINTTQYEFQYKCDMDQKFLEDKYNEYIRSYPCDGVVITSSVTYNGFEFDYDEIAYKFKNETEVTTVDHIEWNLTRTGKMIPTAVINPVNLSGATIRRASAFNAKYVSDNSLGSGSIVEICRSGEVIPYILSVDSSNVNKDSILPTKCPVCGEDLKWSGVDLICDNEYCGNSEMSDLWSWINCLTYDIHGLGYSIKKDFLDENGIKSVSDLYDSLRNNWYKLPSTPHANKLISEMIDILKNGKFKMRDFLVALNIKRLGWTSAAKICESAKSINDVTYDLVKDTCGYATAESFNSERDKFLRMKMAFINRIYNEKEDDKEVNTESKGKVVITGKLESGTRKQFEDVVKSAGYILDGSVNKDTVYLITNDPNSGSSKNRKADELGVKKITEKEFLDMIKGN